MFPSPSGSGGRGEGKKLIRHSGCIDTIFGTEALRHLAAQVGTGQIVMGTDYPFPWQDKSVDHILNTPTLSDAQRVAMLGGTAAKLLGIK